MKKEVTRMKNLRDQLRRRQEGLVAEMEKSIYKRELISLKGRSKQLAEERSASRSTSTKATLSRAVSDMKAKIATVTKTVKQQV